MTLSASGDRSVEVPRRPHWSQQLHVKLLTIITAAFLTIGLPAGWLLFGLMQQNDDASLTARIGNLAARTAGAIERHRAYDDLALSYDLMAPLAADRAFLCVELHQRETVIAALPAGQGCVDRPGDQALTLPIDDRGIHALRVAFSDVELRETRNVELLVGLSAVTLAFLALALAGGIAYRLMIWRPLQHLSDAILQSARSGRRHSAPWNSRDEIGLVVAAYNNLISEESRRERELKASYDQLRASENALNEINQQLERRVEARTAELREAIRASDSANASKTHFLWSMSHELRTPLNAIIGFSEIISRQMFGTVQPARYREVADDILFSGQHLLNVINDLLDIARIEAGRETLDEEAVSIAALFAETQRVVQPLAEERKIALSRTVETGDLTLLVDHTKLKQILLNLLANAINHTPAGGSVSLWATRAPDGRIELRVADTGRGIAASEMATVLEPFGRSDSSVRQPQKGTGLGLPLARHMTELHGGELRLESTVGTGTTVTVSLPQNRIVSTLKVATQAAAV